MMRNDSSSVCSVQGEASTKEKRSRGHCTLQLLGQNQGLLLYPWEKISQV